MITNALCIAPRTLKLGIGLEVPIQVVADHKRDAVLRLRRARTEEQQNGQSQKRATHTCHPRYLEWTGCIIRTGIVSISIFGSVSV